MCWKEGAWKSRKSAISFYYHLQMRVGESEMLIMASPLYSKKQYYKIYEIKSNEEGNADCMTLFSEHLPICKEKKGASAAPSKLFWESVRRRKKFFRSVPSLAPFQSTTEFRSEQNINTTLKQVCVYLIKASLLLYQLFLSYIIPDGEPTASGKQRYIAYEKTPKLPSQITEVIRRIHFYLILS